MSLVRSKLLLAVLLSFLSLTALADDDPAYRTDENPDPKLSWFQLEVGQFPPEGSAHYFSGELIKSDHLERKFVLRVDRTDSQNRSHFDLPVATAMLPYGSLHYHGATAALKHIPLGTHLHGWFYVKDPNDKTKPLEIFHNRRSYEVDFTRCFRIEDDFSFHQNRGEIWRIETINLGDMRLTVQLLKDEKPIGKPTTYDLKETTRVWQGRSVGTFANLKPGQLVQFNITWATLYGPGRVVEIWVDDESRKLASEFQRKKHREYIKERGLPGWIDAVDNQNRMVTVTLFGGVDQELLSEVTKGQSGGLAVAEDNLLMYDPVNDRKRGSILDVKTVPKAPGSSGVQFQIKPDLLLEGFRPKRIIRLYPGSWPVVALPKEEGLFGR